MRTINFSHSEIIEVFDTVVALLNLGNVKFQENDSGSVSPTFQTKEYFLKCSQLLKCDLKSLTRALTLKI
jgi:myosin heavy subunit